MRTQTEEVRGRIVEAAYKSFWRQGFRRSSVDSIAERAGLTKRTVYAYFRSKDDLLAVVMQRYEELAAERLEHIGKRLPADRVGLVELAIRTVERLGKHDAALVGIGVHPAGRRARGFARSSCASDRASRQGEDEIMDRRAAGRRARCERAGPRTRDHAADGRLDGADAYSWWARLYGRRCTSCETPRQAEIDATLACVVLLRSLFT